MPARVVEDEAGIARAAACLRAGEIIVFPTDTLYGLGADATNEAAVARLFAIKGREETKPFLVLVRDLAEARLCARIEGGALTAAQRFWPGPLTLVVERTNDSPLARNLNPLGDTIGLRVPAREPTLALIRLADRPIAAPSANRAGAPPARNAAEANAALGDDVSLVLDGGDCAGTPSSVIECLGDGFRLLREGAIPHKKLEEILGKVK